MIIIFILQIFNKPIPTLLQVDDPKEYFRIRPVIMKNILKISIFFFFLYFFYLIKETYVK